MLSNGPPSERLSSTVYTITDQQMIPSGFPWNERHRAIESCVNGGWLLIESEGSVDETIEFACMVCYPRTLHS
jgi:hypothetical protein